MKNGINQARQDVELVLESIKENPDYKNDSIWGWLSGYRGEMERLWNDKVLPITRNNG